jgi:hypothetical protein
MNDHGLTRVETSRTKFTETFARSQAKLSLSRSEAVFLFAFRHIFNYRTSLANIMSAIVKEAITAFGRKVPKGAQYWSRTLPSINVSSEPTYSIFSVWEF